MCLVTDRTMREAELENDTPVEVTRMSMPSNYWTATTWRTLGIVFIREVDV